MDPDLRSQLNMLLINGGHDKKLQEQLLYTLNAHSNNWPTQVQNRALALLRSGEVTTFPVLLKQILDEVRKETAAGPAPKTSSSSSANGNGPAESGAGGSSTNNGAGATVQVNGSKKHAGPGPGEASNLNRETTTSLAVPATVVEEALKVTRDVLKEVAEFEEESNGAT
ncbi:hypothetical protein INS49_006982 [Diaporthe citri]|uniref:uncharacterized protein n=1 Tax=Diaporthe citri TaxID=83186 RepID=UPI001C806A85|nr:uncharacterized protein INS49_006982 [Diaporthe citri]KAG6365371.1 hypothetical protein INS49_006982 [Diaporthe citri]